MPEHDGESMGMGGTMRLGKRTTTFLTKNCVLSILKCFFLNITN